MTIRKFNEWGRVIPRPKTIELCNSDAEVAKLANHHKHNLLPIPYIHLTGGSLAHSLGDSLPLSDAEVHELPIDLLQVRYSATNDIQRTAIAANSVVMRHTFWRGQIIAITNCGYFGEWEIAPRAHPNDGVFDVVEVDANMSCRQRLSARSRLPLGTHMPHPSIRQHQSQSETWIFTRPIGLYLDQEFVGPTTRVVVTIEPDAMKLLI